MRASALLWLSLSALAACQWSGRQPVTPQRPTVSFDTSTTAAGTVELETGVNVDPGDSFDSPTTVKYGTGERSELFVGYSPYQQVDVPGGDVDGGSDTVLGVRTRLFDGGGAMPSAALVFSGKLPTASVAAGLGSGQPDLRVGGVLNKQFGPITANAFYQYGALGNATGGSRSEHTATLGASWPVADRIGAFGEVAGVFVPSLGTDSVISIVGLTYTPEPWLVLDGGVTVGWSDDAPDLQLFVGCTYNFGAPGQ